MAPKPSLISKRSSTHLSAFFRAIERSGRMCTRSNQWVRRSSDKKKLRQESSFLSQCKCIRDLSRPATNNSSTPISSEIFLKGFFTSQFENLTRITRDQDNIS